MSDDYIKRVEAVAIDEERTCNYVVIFRDKAEYFVRAQTCASACVLSAWHRYVNEGQRHDKCLKVLKCEVLPCSFPVENRSRFCQVMV